MSVAGPSSRTVVVALGLVQILAWGSSFYFPAVFAPAIVAETGWPLSFVVGGVSIGLLVGGLISPQVGQLIGRHGGLHMLASSSVLFAAGLTGIGLAPSLPFYIAAWCMVGLGMGTGLYDAVFAALGRRYGDGARAHIATLTLIGGFASTVCWPLSAWLLEAVGWRGACFAYAALHLFVGLPLQLLVMRDGSAGHDGKRARVHAAAMPHKTVPHERAVMILLALILSVAAGIGSIVIVHMMVLLQALGIAFAAAVSLGMLFGPAQVGARLIERLFGLHYHPVWTLLAATALMLAGLALMLTGPTLVALAIVLYAAGYGITWIARGTLPLTLFGAARYPAIAGRLALPSLIAQALAPTLGAFLIEQAGGLQTIATLCVLAALNVALMLALWRLTAASRSA